MNWCKGETCSSATLVLFRLILVRRRRRDGSAVSDGGAHAFHGAEHIEHAGSDAQQQKHDQPPGFRPEEPVESPTGAEAEDHGDHQLQTNAETEAHRAAVQRVPLSVTGCRSLAVATRLAQALTHRRQIVAAAGVAPSRNTT